MSINLEMDLIQSTSSLHCTSDNTQAALNIFKMHFLRCYNPFNTYCLHWLCHVMIPINSSSFKTMLSTAQYNPAPPVSVTDQIFYAVAKFIRVQGPRTVHIQRLSSASRFTCTAQKHLHMLQGSSWDKTIREDGTGTVLVNLNCPGMNSIPHSFPPLNQNLVSLCSFFASVHNCNCNCRG